MSAYPSEMPPRFRAPVPIDEPAPDGSVSISIARQGLQHAHAVIFGVDEGDVLANARYLHRLTQHLAASLGNFPHRAQDVIHRDDDGGMLHRPVGLPCVEPAVYRAWLLGTALIRFGSRGQHVV